MNYNKTLLLENLKKINILLYDSQGNERSVDSIYKDIDEIWNKLDYISKRHIVVKRILPELRKKKFQEENNDRNN